MSSILIITFDWTILLEVSLTINVKLIMFPIVPITVIFCPQYPYTASFNEKLKNAKSSEIPEIVDRMLLDRYFFREEVAIFKYLRRFPEDKEDELLFGLSLIQNEELKNRDMTPPYFKYGRLQMFFKDINLSSPDCMLDKANQIAKAVSRLVLEGGNTAII